MYECSKSTGKTIRDVKVNEQTLNGGISIVVDMIHLTELLIQWESDFPRPLES